MTMINASNNSNKYTCIYCLQEKDQKEFNTEHVMLKSFGVYGSQNITLINMINLY
jgi:hypothetical protein